MGKRVTIILDDDLLKKLRLLQAKLIKESSTSVSFSKVINEVCKKSLKAIWIFQNEMIYTINL